MAAVRILLVALLPGLLLPQGAAFRLCFCALIGDHHGAAHDRSCHGHGDRPHEHGGSPGSAVLTEGATNGCFCVRVSLAGQPTGMRPVDGLQVDPRDGAPAAVLPLPVALPPPATQHSTPVESGFARSPLPSASRSLPLLI